MSDVKWIKLSTSMFDDEKIRLIEQMPDADTILIIWVKLLTQAGKTNSSGYIFLSENIPYTDEMLATIFNRPLSTIRLALKTFEELGMVGIDDNSFISITNWEKHQNVEGLERIRKQNRIRKRRQRERERKKLESKSHVTSRDGHAPEEDKEEDKEEDIKYIVEIVTYLNDMANRNYRHTTRKTQSLIRARMNEGFTVDDFKRVIDIKTDEWLNDSKMNKYLRPETLFGTKFESYLNQETESIEYDPSKDAF